MKIKSFDNLAKVMSLSSPKKKRNITNEVLTPEVIKAQAPCRVYLPHAGNVTYWFPYATFVFTCPFLPFTRVTPRSHAGSSPPAYRINPLIILHTCFCIPYAMGTSHTYYNQTVL
eukprot:4056273-Ditylum_brightwellii.AAC.1